MTSFAQAPDIEWQNTIGGSLSDNLPSIAQTDDNGYILGGYSNSSISGDKTENNLGFSDYWVVKLNMIGALEWQKNLGGSLADVLNSIAQTADGGYILGGHSISDISGDKTENSQGSYDFWVIKLDTTGSIAWQKTIGGNNLDYLRSISQTTDGGYILGGYSKSSISGNKAENCFGDYDYWVVKINSTGSIEWQTTLGGSKSDVLYSIKQTTDGGYILAGYSDSNISGNKTEISNGENDYWVVKLNSTGFIEWQNTIGGSNADYLTTIDQTLDGGYIIGGNSYSNTSGDKTDDCRGKNDYWIIKLDAVGNIESQKTIGGNSFDYLLTIGQTDDHGYILGGQSMSNLSGDKTENSNGFYDYWVIKLDSTLAIEWQNSIGGASSDFLYAIAQTNDGGFALCGESSSNISGDKSENSLGDADYCVIKLAGPPCIPIIEVCNTVDDDCDGLIDEESAPIINISAGGTTTFCQGGNVILTATHSGTSLQWKKNGVSIAGATNVNYNATKTGNYTCLSTNDCGITLSATISVIVNKNPPASITAGGPTAFCLGDNVVLTANAGGGLSYQWYKGAAPIAGATTIAYTATTSGNYKCRVTKNITGCFKNSNTVMVSIVCKEGENEITSQPLELHPNPATRELIINCSSNIHSAQLFNNIGQLIMVIPVSDGFAYIDISAMATGIYFIRAEGEAVQWVKQ